MVIVPGNPSWWIAEIHVPVIRTEIEEALHLLPVEGVEEDIVVGRALAESFLYTSRGVEADARIEPH